MSLSVLLLLCGLVNVIQANSLLFAPHETRLCLDKKGSCAEDSTCCQRLTGDYGCCPLPEATCCSDHLHCCPSTYQCDMEHEQCIQSDGQSLSWFSKLPAHPVNTEENADAVVCPDQQYQCPDDQTCCQLSTGQWACCPLPQAVCCPDKVHCCPNSYTCDTAQQQCIKGPTSDGPDSLPWIHSTLPSKYLPVDHKPVGDITCDDKSSCPDDQTCCKLSDESYGCCPLPEAVCCEDHIHCCPNGCTCNVDQGTCDGCSLSGPWSTKLPAKMYQPATGPEPSLPEASSGVKACSAGAWCKDGSTCCEFESGVRGCCPFSNAICCSDGLHCCPAGSTCDAALHSCRSVDSSLMFTWHITGHVDGYGGLRPLSVAAAVQCPDGSTCPTSTTCCQVVSKQYACCPYDQAMCCSDLLHCCPHGMTCNVKESRCDQAGLNLPWNMFGRNRSKQPAVREGLTGVAMAKDTCPDLKSLCPVNSTCCEMQSGAYGCCPLDNAVCCSDKLHCCPYGTTCDVQKQSCVSSTAGVKTNAPETSNKADVPEASNKITDINDEDYIDEEDVLLLNLNPRRFLP